MIWKKIGVVLGVIVFLVISGFFYVMSYGFYFPPCSKYEEYRPAPNLMETSDIIFEKQRFYIIPPEKYKVKKVFWDRCTDMRAEASGSIMAQNDGDTFLEDNGYKVVPIEKNTRFKLVRRAFVHANGIYALGGGWGDTYLLKDNNSKEWYIDPISFKNAAGYYNGNQRIGDVSIVEEYSNGDQRVVDVSVVGE